MELLVATPIYNIYVEKLKAPGREGEKSTVREMIISLFAGSELSHKPSGAPFVEGTEKYISVSHGAGYAVVAVGDKPIGVDIEAPRQQLDRIRHKFMRPDDCSESLLHAWTAKEAAFKAAESANVTVHDIAINGNSASIPGFGNKIIDYYNLDTAIIAIAH
ncbi:MAG: 4'-phosphopantetheinyl transferase superfamily protein [Paramuribaculum sp.]|nr:4'-phosphopantetheinyl transferase superfamily protein [Paramuribaculum sp.]MDE6652179.1 4'-phosphopantetheinyl transferase superfamily protein [Paramuribaculum sp.]